MQQEYTLRDSDFNRLAKLVMDVAGIVLSDKKRAFIHSRLGRRLRQLGLTDFGAYCRLLETKDGEDERANLINAITTNHTAFFREMHHFDYLAKVVLPTIAGAADASKRLRIWSAGCSTGEEPYSIAMTLRSQQSLLKGFDIKVLATDLDTNVIAHAADGIYDRERVEGIPGRLLDRFVSLQDGRGTVKPEVRDLISFAPLNLLHDWPMRGPFDVIFCRNVVIYFDKPTQRRLFDRYAELLKPDGWLFIGHSESLLGVTERFDLIGRTTYRRVR